MPNLATSLLPSLVALAAGALALCAGGAAPPVPPASAERTVEVASGKSMRYRLVTPEGFDPAVAAPTMLLLPPGSQDGSMVDAALGYVAPAAQRRRWVIVCPEALPGEPFATSGRVHLAPLLQAVRATLKVEGGRVHVAGISNGGRSALAFAVASPEECASVFAFPGAFPSEVPAEPELRRLAAVPVRLLVGEKDSPAWRDSSEAAVKALVKAGVDATLEVRPGQPHVIRDLGGDAILDMLDRFRPQQATAADEAAIGRTLDALHDAASKADGARYFALFAPGAVFIGTDATERWTIEQFKAYAEHRFAEGKGWTYHLRPGSRRVTVDSPAGYAFFDELLDNEKYGECRGTGVLRRCGDRWLIAQYHLTVPVPNELLESVAAEIRRAAKTR